MSSPGFPSTAFEIVRDSLAYAPQPKEREGLIALAAIAEYILRENERASDILTDSAGVIDLLRDEQAEGRIAVVREGMQRQQRATERRAEAAEARADQLQQAFNTEVRVCSARTTILEQQKARADQLQRAISNAAAFIDQGDIGAALSVLTQHDAALADSGVSA